MLTDRRIYTAPGADLVVFNRVLVKLFAHAVQALEFEVPVVPGEFQYGSDGVCVVGGELRIKRIGVGKQFAGTRQI